MTVTRLLDTGRPALNFTVDGTAIQAQAGDTLLVAMLAGGLGHVRNSEFGDGGRAGFCWMGACQDCLVHVEGLGVRRACTTLVTQDMQVRRR